MRELWIKEIKTELDNLICPIHGNAPQVSVLNGEIEIEQCCDIFRLIIIGQYNVHLTEKTQQHLTPHAIGTRAMR